MANVLSNHCTTAWVTQPERQKGAKNEVKQARRAPRLLVFYIVTKDTGTETEEELGSPKGN